MSFPLSRLLPALVSILSICIFIGPGATQASTVPSIEIDSTIDPASSAWLEQALDDAERDGAELVIVRLDTPGGLMDDMRKMVKRIIAAPMPVVVYVYPDGARAASAGLFITEAADVAAMAPQTNIGSATPITIGPGTQDKVLGRKIKNDAAAYIRALTEEHGRNPNLAEEMVRKATNVTAVEAKERGLIDIVAANQAELLRKLNGFQVKGPKRQKLSTAGLEAKDRDTPFKFRALGLIVNPNVAFILLLIGIAGIAFEFFNPGMILPGALGVISLVLALFALSQLPITVAGVLLILLAIGLIVAETQIISGGALGVAGAVSLAAGGLLLFDNKDGFGISIPLVIFTAVLFAGFTLFVMSKAVNAHKKRVHTGWEELAGESGDVREPLEPQGMIFIQGALWRAKSMDGDTIETGSRVVVDRVEGLTLIVHRTEDT